MPALLLPLLALVLAFASPVAIGAAGAAAAKRHPAAAPRPPLTAKPAPSRDVRSMSPRERRCHGLTHQPAAEVLLNRATVPRSICVRSCEARLVAPRRQSGRIAALTIYTGRACRLPPGYRDRPATRIAKADLAPRPTTSRTAAPRPAR